MPSSLPATPARGTRPSNRRAITLQAATELFYRRGYTQVSMTDIAKATNVGASAIYRHFPGKAELLVAAIQSGLEPYEVVLSDTGPTDDSPAERLEGVVSRLAVAAIENRRLGVLWQRDARSLPEADQRVLREELSRATSELARLIGAARSGLTPAHADTLAWCAMGALVSLGFHSLELPRPAFEELLVDIVSAVVCTPLSDDEPSFAHDAEPARFPASRRDELITVATTLFADRGFAAAGIDDIGDAAGMAGPSVYSHFGSKSAILAAAIRRGSDILQNELDAVLESADEPRRKLGRAIDSYVRLVNRDRFIVRTLISEMDQLPEADRDVARREQRAYVDAWVGLRRAFSADDEVSARIRVQAVLLVVNDAVQTPHLRAQPDSARTLRQVAKNVLGVGTDLLA